MKTRMLIIFLIASTSGIPNKSCDRLRIGNNWYDKDIIWSDLGRPYNLNIHKGSNTLFFSYTQPETYSDLDFQLAYYNLDSNDHENIIGIRGGCAVAINQATDEIYLGGSEGIYKYNMLTKLADFYKEDGVNIWGLFYKRNLFYISYPDQKLHIQIDDKFAPVKEFADTETDHFHVNQDNVIYFANKTGLYKYNNDNNNIEIVDNLITVRQIVEDVEGSVYVCTNLGLFLVKNDSLEKVMDMKNVHGLAFDRDNNIVISDEKNVIKLVISESGCLEGEDHW